MKKLFAMLMCVALVLSFAGCGAKGEKVESGERTVTDMSGREVTISGKIERIVVVTPSDCEILYAIGAGSLVVGRGQYCNYPEESQGVDVVASGDELNTEQIIALQPQLVFLGTMAQNEDQVNALEAAGAKVFTTDADTIEETYESIKLIGQITGYNDGAEKVISEMKAAFDKIKADVADKEAGSVYFEVSPLEYGLWSAGNNTFMNEIAEMLGLTNIFSDLDGWAQVSEEQIIERNPDYIVTITMYYGEGPTPEEEIAARNGWQSINAVSMGKIISIDSDSISRPAPRLADAAKELYDFVYSD